MPLGCPRFVDVFGGSGTVMLGKQPNNDFEVLNDYDGDLVNLFRCVKERPLALIRELGFLTLNSRDDFNVLRKFIAQEEFDDAYLQEEMELTQIMLQPVQADEICQMMLAKANAYDIRRASNFLKLIRYSYASGRKSFAAQPFDIRKLFTHVWDSYNRLANVVIESKDFGDLIKHYDRVNTVFYCDPPYYKSEGVYAKIFTLDDHLRLYHTLSHMKGKFLLSYNDCAFIRAMYKDYYIFDFSRIHSMVQRYEAGRQYPELLISNYDMYERQRSKPLQLTFPNGDEEFDYDKILKECIISCKISH